MPHSTRERTTVKPMTVVLRRMLKLTSPRSPGNATAVAIGNAYYPDNRTVSSNVSKFTVQIGVDVVANILKEFAPDLERVLSRRQASQGVRPEHPALIRAFSQAVLNGSP